VLSTLESQRITRPGPDKMVVFQNYSLLPWLTVRQNIALAVNRVMVELPRSERCSIIEDHIRMVGLRPHAEKKAEMLSGGQKQRVEIARALAIRPKLLLLEACQYCSNPTNAAEICQILTQREYLGMSEEFIQLNRPDTESMRYSHHLFYGDQVNRPSRTEQLWHILQLAR